MSFLRDFGTFLSHLSMQADPVATYRAICRSPTGPPFPRFHSNLIHEDDSGAYGAANVYDRPSFRANLMYAINQWVRARQLPRVY